MNDKLKELSHRANKRLQTIPLPKTAEDARKENEDFSFLEPQVYKEITREGQNAVKT